MLIETYSQFEKPVNWPFVRWEYARYFAAPFLGAFGQDKDIEAKGLEAVRDWENAVGIWENDEGQITCVVCPDEYVPWHPARGIAYFQRRPGYDHLLDEMLEYAQKKYRKDNTTSVFITEPDTPLQEAAKRDSYAAPKPATEYWTEYDLSKIPDTKLPGGFYFQSMADNNDVERRRKIFGLSFYHKPSNEWPSAFSYRELQKAPDYRRELDLVVVAPDGEFVSCCIAWIDETNKVGMLEPVGSIVLGMGREIVLEGLRRLKALGAEIAIMETPLKYYTKIGFVRKWKYGRKWEKTLITDR